MASAVSFFVALIAILNPFGNLAFFIGAVDGDDLAVQNTVAKLFGVAVFLILIFFYFTGQKFLAVFGITIPAFRIAGGILILLVGVRMMNGRPKFDTEGLKAPEDASTFKRAQARLSSIIVPIAMPLFVGPGAMTTVILFSQQIHGVLQHFLMVCAMAAVCAAVSAIMHASRWFARLLGANGMQIITRSMGLILCAMSVQFMIDGLNQLFPDVINPLFIHVK